jgi:hypothetical protein
MKKFIFLFLLSTFFVSTSALRAEDATFKIHGFLDTYYATDNNNIRESDGFGNGRSYSLLNSREDEFGLNIAQVCMYGNYGAARGKLVLHYGELAMSTIDEDYSGSPLVQQANAGFNVFGNFWVDAGYFHSHIGDEVFSPGHNWLSSYSIVRQNQPWFHAGVRFGYETEKMKARLFVLNAKHTFAENNANKTYGIFFSYKPMESFTISYGNLLGNEESGKPSDGLMEMLHNVCAEFEVSKEFALKGELDYSTFENPDPDGDAASSMGIVVAGHYKFTPKCSGTARFAMLSETNYNGDSYGVNHITLGAEYNPTASSYFRLEGSMLSFGDAEPFYDKDGKPTDSRMELILNFGIYIK